MMKPLFVLFIFLFSSASLAIVDGHEYVFEGKTPQEIEQKQVLFQTLAQELRCPKCQNQNLSDSNAMIAGDLRRELYQQVKAGGDEQSIIDFMVQRYGEFVLYKPKVNAMTYVLWYGPVALLLIALICLIMIIKKRKQSQTNSDIVLSDEQEKRLNDLLNQDKGDDHV